MDGHTVEGSGSCLGGQVAKDRREEPGKDITLPGHVRAPDSLSRPLSPNSGLMHSTVNKSTDFRSLNLKLMRVWGAILHLEPQALDSGCTFKFPWDISSNKDSSLILEY